MEISDLKHYGPKNIEGYRCSLVVVANFSKFEWTLPMTHKFSLTMEDSIKNFLNFSKRKPSGGGRQFVNRIFTEFLETDDYTR